MKEGLIDPILGLNYDLQEYDPDKYCKVWNGVWNGNEYSSISVSVGMIDFMPVGLSVTVGDTEGSSRCGSGDAIWSIKYKVNAQKCMNIMEKGCQSLKEKACPCFNLKTLYKEIMCSSDNMSCRSTSDGVLGIYENTLTDPRIAIDTNSNTCMNNDMEVISINSDQMDHCSKLFDRACVFETPTHLAHEEDSLKFLFRGQTRKWCKWAKRKKTSDRCSKWKIARNCPFSCKKNCLYNRF